MIDKKYVFRSNSDSEVLIHGYDEWGIKGLLDKINGIFAFAIWDSRLDKLIMQEIGLVNLIILLKKVSLFLHLN